jgi:enoyl-CoA hydratase/carnithine racemase
LNSLTIKLLREFIEALELASKDNEVRVIILTGMGKGFCSGADMDFLQYLIDLRSGARFRQILRDLVQKVVNGLEQTEKPIIAAINGAAAGGGAELALGCDFRVASEDAFFLFTEVKLGIIPDAGGIPRLTRLLGCAKAKEIILTGKKIGGKEAETIGLVNKCVPHEELLTEAKRLAETLITCAPLAMGVAKRIIDKAMDVDLMSALDMVGFAQSELMQTKDFQEGVKAFLEKRKALFRGE